MALHRMHYVVINTTALNGQTAVGFADGVSVIRQLTDGLTDAQFASVNEQNPRLSFATKAVGAGLTSLGFDGARTSITAYDALMGTGGSKATGTSHVEYIISTALIVPRQLSVSGTGDAVLSGEAIGYGTAPAIDTAHALPVAAVASVDFFGMGPVFINAEAIGGVQSVDINFGISEIIDRGDGEIMADDVRIISRLPVVTIVTNDPGMRADVGAYAAIASATTVKLRKRLAGGTYSTSADNVLMTFTGGMVRSVQTANDPRLTTFVIEPTGVTISTTAAA